MALSETERARLSAAHYANYQEYNKTLRTWFVTFGLGVPALLLVNDKLWPALYAYTHHTRIILLYIIGCAAQVGVAMLNKVIAWHNYDDHQTTATRDARFHKLCRKLENVFLIDMAADAITAIAFAYATLLVFAVFAH
jgi:hypothetical protein